MAKTKPIPDIALRATAETLAHWGSSGIRAYDKTDSIEITIHPTGIINLKRSPKVNVVQFEPGQKKKRGVSENFGNILNIYNDL
jgi:hypothetical protein